MSWRVIGHLNSVAIDLDILFLIMLRANLLVIGEIWILSCVFRLLCGFSFFDDFSNSSFCRMLDVCGKFGSIKNDGMRR